MNRTLILQELKHTFLTWISAAIVIALISLAAKPVLVRYAGNSDGEKIINTIIACLFAGIASGLGVSAFAKEFREGPLRLLENLPIPRAQIWFVRCFFSLITLVSIAGLFVLAHPSLIAGDHVLPIGVSIGLLLFIGGLYLGMIVPAAGAAVVLVNLLVTASFSMALHVWMIATVQVQALGTDFSVYAALWYAPGVVAGLVVFFYGEFDVKRRQFINRAVSSAVTIVAGIAIILVANSGVLARSEGWKIAQGIGGKWRWDISPDARHVALVAQRDFHPLVTRAVVIDVESGKVAATLDQAAIHDLVWTTTGSAIVSSDGTVAERVLGLGAPTGRITRVFPRVETILQESRSMISGSASTKWGTYFSVNSTGSLQRWKGKSAVLQLEENGTKEILSTPSTLLDFKVVYNSPVGVLFGSNANDKTWFIGTQIRNVSYMWLPFGAADENESKSVQQALLQSIPRHSGAQVKGVFVYSEVDYQFDEGSWIYFLQTDAEERTARLLARRKGDAQWNVVISDIPYTYGSQVLRGGGFLRASFFGLWVGARDGLVVQAYRSASESKIRLVNLTTGERFDLPDKNTYETEDRREIEVSRSIDHIEIILRTRKGKLLAIMPSGYSYAPGKGTPTPITAVPNLNPGKLRTFKTPSGIQIREDSGKLTAISPDGATRQLWPQ